MYLRAFFLAVLLANFSSASFALDISGSVIDEVGNPIKDARVRIQTLKDFAITNSKGYFRLKGVTERRSIIITAGKEGYFNTGEKFKKGQSNYRLILKQVATTDHKDYQWIPPSLPFNHAVTKVKPCKLCHPELFEQWSQSSHSSSAVNPLFLSLFSGRTKTSIVKKGLSFKDDFPKSNGNCVTCHIPEMALQDPFGSDPIKASGIEKRGVFCDFCHKIKTALHDKQGGRPGTLSIKLRRPKTGGKQFFGPLDDAFPGPDSFSPLHKKSIICAPCHSGKFWGNKIYGSFDEWLESPSAKKNENCQACHMKPDKKFKRFAVKDEGGLVRNPLSIFTHSFSGFNDKSFMQNGVALSIDLQKQADELLVTIKVKNRGTGHSLPTGSPMRNMILKVTAVGDDAHPLKQIAGSKIPRWAGGKDGLAGSSGKGFTKLFIKREGYPSSKGTGRFLPIYPEPYWRPANMISDTRIPAGKTDVSRYRFAIPKNWNGKIKAKLIIRKTFATWLTNDLPASFSLTLKEVKASL